MLRTNLLCIAYLHIIFVMRSTVSKYTYMHMYCVLQDYVGIAGAILIGAGIVGAGLAGLFVDKTGKFEESAKTSLSFASLALIAFMLVSTL